MIRKIYFTLFIWISCLLTALAQDQIRVTGRQCVPDYGCEPELTRFELVDAKGDPVEGTNFTWNFGDTDPSILPENNTSTKQIATHSYKNKGTYTATLTYTPLNSTTPVTVTSTPIEIQDIPPYFEFFIRQGKAVQDTLICEGEKLTLDPYKGNAPTGVTYLWAPNGETTPTLEVSESGCYSVEVFFTNPVTGEKGCSTKAKIEVKVCGETPASPSSKWYFGSEAGLDFQGSDPTALTDGKMDAKEGSSAISDKKGQLLFYTDGITVYDKEGNPMNAENPLFNNIPLGGGKNSTQAALIIPLPICRGCEYQYYIFTTKDIENGNKCLEYSVVDMRLNSGKGLITQKNVRVECGITERLSAIKKPVPENNNGGGGNTPTEKPLDEYWIVTHDTKGNYIIKKLTASGLVDGRTQEIGLPHDTNYKGEGQIKFSSDGNKVAVVIPGGPPDNKNYVEVYNFNNETGELSNKVTLELGDSPPVAYGVEFSPDGGKLYATLKGNKEVPATGNDPAVDAVQSTLLQFDLSAGDQGAVQGTKREIAKSDNIYGALQYGPDGKIYMAMEGSDSLAVIGLPNELASKDSAKKDVDFKQNGIYLGGKTSQLGLPNFVQNEIESPSGPGISANDVCFGEPVVFQSSPICEPKGDTYTWDFGDGEKVTVSGKQGQQPINHTYKSPGTYTVKLHQSNDCKDFDDTKQVVVTEVPKLDLASPYLICGPSVTIDTKYNAANTEFFWFKDTETTPLPVQGSKLEVTESGTYTVFAVRRENEECYDTKSATVQLEKKPDFSLPIPDPLCVGKTTTLDAGPGATSYQWSNGATTQQVAVGNPGTYSVTAVIPVNGVPCSVEDKVTLIQYPNPNVRVRPEVPLCVENNQIVDLNGGGNPTYNYLWNTGESTMIIKVSQPNQYKVTVTTQQGCSEEHMVNVIEQCEPLVLVPNAFSPNGDGQNDRLQVVTNHITNQDYEFRVYDRWGELIFRTTDRNETWDGTYKGRPYPPQSYAWTVQYRSLYFPQRGVETKRGAVLIAR